MVSKRKKGNEREGEKEKKGLSQSQVGKRAGTKTDGIRGRICALVKCVRKVNKLSLGMGECTTVRAEPSIYLDQVQFQKFKVPLSCFG